jgi:hypothetical protein
MTARHDNLLRNAAAAALCMLAVAGCGSSADETTSATYKIEFQGMVGEQPFSCEGEFGDIGIGKTTIKPLDFRFWIHDMALVRANGEAVKLSLKEDQPTSTIRDDGAWQTDNVALIDMENATGSCRPRRERTSSERRRRMTTTRAFDSKSVFRASTTT